MSMEANCKGCGSLFNSTRKRRKGGGWTMYCASSCAQAGKSAALAARATKICTHCNQEKSSSLFREKRMVCKACSNGPQKRERKLKSGAAASCPVCESLFIAPKRDGEGQGFNKFCSRECANKALETRPDGACLQCGSHIKKAIGSDGYTRNFCSLDCRNAHRVGPGNPLWKGGVSKVTGEVRIYVGRRPGYVSTSQGAHRVIASSAIGRKLTRGEYVIHINGDNGDNRPDNLFICESQSEYRKRRVGKSMPWPTESNLDTYTGGEAT